MDCYHYGQTLAGWAAGANTPSSISLGASGLKYSSAAVPGRSTLMGTKSWTITDGGVDDANCPCEWIGKTNSDWATSSNWYLSTLPSSGNYLKISDTAQRDLVLDQNRTIGKLTFSNTSKKKVVLGGFNLTATSFANANSDNYVQTTGAGVLKMTVANSSTVMFAVGKSSYNPLEITNNTGSGDDFTVRVLDEAYEGGLTGGVLIPSHVKRTWDIGKSSANGGSGINFKFYWNVGEVSGSLPTPTLNHYDGSARGIAIGSSSSLGNTLTHTGYTGGFSPFAIGGGPIPLPVELLNFEANPDYSTRSVHLTWQTAQEMNNSHFVVMRSEEGSVWEDIGVVGGAGNSYSLTSYQTEDIHPSLTSYYRLRQVDKDGTSSLSAIRFVTFTDSQTQTFSVQPNPNTGVITVAGTVVTPYCITDLQGRLLMQGILHSGNTNIDMRHLANGLYLIKIQDRVEKIVKE